MLNYCDPLFAMQQALTKFAKVKYMQNIVALRYLLGLDALLSKPLSGHTLGRGVVHAAGHVQLSPWTTDGTVSLWHKSPIGAVHGSPLPGTEASHGREVSPLALREDSTRVERRVHLHLVLHIIDRNRERERKRKKVRFQQR